ncbi:unnamed protein product [Polarella glacialis]|uniref:Uncharacterized protein n=1 Tax=Polarella glacialis TaxID=89957 RepID=A0A813H167_POLGL|nr:unnamed protein product [Polarella glacialis]
MEIAIRWAKGFFRLFERVGKCKVPLSAEVDRLSLVQFRVIFEMADSFAKNMRSKDIKLFLSRVLQTSVKVPHRNLYSGGMALQREKLPAIGQSDHRLDDGAASAPPSQEQSSHS